MQLVRIPPLDLVEAALVGDVGVVRLAIAELVQLARKLVAFLDRHRVTGTSAHADTSSRVQHKSSNQQRNDEHRDENEFRERHDLRHAVVGSGIIGLGVWHRVSIQPNR